MQNRAIPIVCPFSEHCIIPVWACDSPTHTTWILGRDLGYLVQRSKGLDRDPKAIEEVVPFLASSITVLRQKLACGQEKGGTAAGLV